MTLTAIFTAGLIAIIIIFAVIVRLLSYLDDDGLDEFDSDDGIGMDDDRRPG